MGCFNGPYKLPLTATFASHVGLEYSLFLSKKRTFIIQPSKIVYVFIIYYPTIKSARVLSSIVINKNFKIGIQVQYVGYCT